jgi:hypothetical protein
LILGILLFAQTTSNASPLFLYFFFRCRHSTF